MAGTDTQQGIGTKVRIDNAVQHQFLVLVQVDIALAVFVPGHGTGADRAVAGHGTSDVGRHLVGVPAAVAGVQIAAEIAPVGVFAHQVDGGRRVARAGQQAGGTPHDFNTFVQGDVGDRLAGTPRQGPGQRHPIDLVVGDFEAARGEAVTDIIDFIDRHTHRIVDHVRDGRQILVEDALLGDDGH